MSLLALRTETKAYLETALIPTLTALMGRPVAVSTHEGRFDEDTIMRCAKGAPHVVVAFDKITTEIMGGEVWGTTNAVVTCFTVDGAQGRRDELGLVLVGEVLRVLSTFVPDTACAKAPTDFVAKNAYTEKFAKTGCHLWAIGYRQKLELPPAVAINYDDLLGVDVEYDLVPTDGENEAEDEIDLPGP